MGILEYVSEIKSIIKKGEKNGFFDRYLSQLRTKSEERGELLLELRGGSSSR